MITQDRLLFDCKEVAAILGISHSMVRKLVRQREIDVVRIGRLVRIHRDELVRIASTDRARVKIGKVPA